jgi:hypothetical protein
VSFVFVALVDFSRCFGSDAAAGVGAGAGDIDEESESESSLPLPGRSVADVS